MRIEVEKKKKIEQEQEALSKLNLHEAPLRGHVGEKRVLSLFLLLVATI